MAIPTDVPKGRRFSHTYIHSDPADDSERVRKRLGAFIGEYSNTGVMKGARADLQMNLGVDVAGGEASIRASFWSDAEMRDVLDAVTLLFHHFNDLGATPFAEAWLEFVGATFEQENLSFELDDQGGVHRKVDPAFSGAMAAAIAGLGATKYKNALTEFEAALAAIDRVPMDGKQAVRRAFTSAEGLFRLIFPKAARLGAPELRQYLGPSIRDRKSWDDTAKRSATKALASFAEWVDAAHFYRHEQGQEEPSQPPAPLAILLVSQGASFIRWLLDFDEEY